MKKKKPVRDIQWYHHNPKKKQNRDTLFLLYHPGLVLDDNLYYCLIEHLGLGLVWYNVDIFLRLL